MAIKLTITTEGDPGASYVRTFMQDSIIIGRSRSADVCLPAMAVSTRHAEIKLAGSDYAAVDLESLNGTQVNDAPLTPFRNRTLKNGDVIAIADFRIGFQMGVAAGGPEPRDTAVHQARDILANVLARSGQAVETKSLYVASGPSRGMRMALPSGPKKLIIGRGNGVDFFVDDPDVSRSHAELVIEAAGIFIRDLKSRNGVRVNGKPVEAIKLDLGDQFTLGGTTISLEHPAERTLGLIFEAPEEDTSSFVLLKERTSVSELQPEISSAAEALGGPESVDMIEKNNDAAPSPAGPVVGPADPLVAPAGNSRVTGSIPLENATAPRDRDSRNTDVGLIIVGAIILAAAVAGLIYLFQ